MTTEPTNPAEPANPAETGAPAAAPDVADAVYGGPTPPVAPSRRGLPRWAWFLIGGGALVMIAFVVVVAIVVNSVIGAVTANEGADQPVAAPTGEPTETAPPTDGAEPSATPGAGVADGALLAVDDQADFGGAFPIWGYPMQDGWEIVIFDQEGVNQSTNEELDCMFTSSQNKQPAQDLEATDDLSDTLATMEALEQGVLENGTGAELIGDLDSTDFALSTPDGQGRIEFVTSRIDFVDPNLQLNYTNQIAGRAMPQAESFMYVVVTCPTALVDAGDSPFEELRAGLQVLVE
ncbi:hypothetical protein K2F54_12040 [Cryobacterium sp. 1639]|uniref:hypothetical protein n=1 Tax=Cryobacterium inferilacus TaxID=2866629 RepID=UPI001C73D4BB|nr:hypothetical protein [Cryobacterium sp. 1639]MBX0300705.1 hypothetical protein [Cryobacterium sp. 1639]